MAINWQGAATDITFTMTDAEFLRFNGVAAASGIPQGSPFYGFEFTVASASGTTTITLPAGKKQLRTIERMSVLLRRLAQSYQVPYTP